MNRLESLRQLPAVDELLRCELFAALRHQNAHTMLVDWIQHSIEQVRGELSAGREMNVEQLPARIYQLVLQQQLVDQHRRIQPVINATGIILHTNLGRSPLALAALERMQLATAYTNLEMELDSGKRSARAARVTDLLARLTGTEDALVVNNCAGAMMLALQATSFGREAIISRGQLVEIGGGFRLPEVFQAAGAILREIGTTNRTYLSDYQTAMCESTGAILRVHRSNFFQSGFVTEPSVKELAGLKRPDHIPLIDDAGSGNMVDLSPFGLKEARVVESVAAGSDLCLFSGDKLFGGPQAGIVVGKKRWVDRLRKSPMLRGLRADKVTLSALEATVEIHLSGKAFEQLPVLQMVSKRSDSIQANCVAVRERLSPSVRERVRIIACQSPIGGGTLPGQTLPSFALAVQSPHLENLARSLRMGVRPIQSRLCEDRLLLDLRTVDEKELNSLASRLDEALSADAKGTP